MLGFGAAVVGGITAAKIGHHGLPVKILAGFILAFGLLLGVLQLGKEHEPFPDGKTAAELTFFEAGEVAVSPDWYNFLILFIGAAGVLLGGGRVKSG